MKKFSLLLIGSLLAFVLGGCNGMVKKDEAVRPPDHEQAEQEYLKGVEESKEIIVAKVDGSDVTMKDLISAMNRLAPKYVKDPRDIDPEIDQKVKQEALDLLIFRELALHEAARQGLRAAPEEVEETMKKIKENMGSDDAFRKSLSLSGNTEESLRRQIERDHLFRMITDKEVLQKAAAGDNQEQSIEKRKREWEAELKKNARIEVTLSVEVTDGAEKPTKE
ncbi:MAG: SurA N-terminal domain-containing protein [Nitrospirae bacterium]|nr:SurA N-terminal domain-containing protein [Nitrospirota bacterium]